MDIKRIIETAWSAIRAHGSESTEFPCIGLFASHHRNELPPEYWLKHLGTATPSYDEILGIIRPVSPDSEEEEIDDEEMDDEGFAIDFSLPGDVTQYVLCVRADDSGSILDISMES